MNRILFVDDEPLVLQGLQRMLRSMRKEWEMEFVEGGPQALELLAKTSFDAIVSDMRMPGMNGAQLLNEVMRCYPGTIRIILSGHADTELILKCVGSTHQVLAKPCDENALKSVMRRASSMEASIKNDKIKRMVCQMDRLPSIPSLYGRMVQLLQDPNATLEEVGAIIEKDIAMTSQLLKLVNSAFFGLRRDVLSPAEAAGYVGVETIRSLVLSLHLFSQFEFLPSNRLSLDAVWRHSLATAAAAKMIVHEQIADKKMAGEAFIAGMLHDSGKLMLAVNFPQQFNDALECAEREGIPLTTVEHHTFGTNHAELGGHLLGLWGLPVPIVEAIAFHHSPARSHEKQFCPLTAVHIANTLVQEDGRPPGGIPQSSIDAEYLKELGLGECEERWRMIWQKSLSKENAI